MCLHFHSWASFSVIGHLFCCFRSESAGIRGKIRGEPTLVIIGGSGQSGLSRKFLCRKESNSTCTFESLPHTESDSRDEIRLVRSGLMAR